MQWRIFDVDDPGLQLIGAHVGHLWPTSLLALVLPDHAAFGAQILMLVMIILDANGVADCRKAKLERGQMIAAARKAFRTADAKDIQCHVRISLSRNLVSVTHQ